MERRRVYNSNFYTQRQLCKCIQLLLISHFRAHWVWECYRSVGAGGRAAERTYYCVYSCMCSCFTSSSFKIFFACFLLQFFSPFFFARVKSCIVWCFIFQFIASHFNNLFHRHNNSGYASLCTFFWVCLSVSLMLLILCLLLVSFKPFCWCCTVYLIALSLFSYRYKRRMSKTHSHFKHSLIVFAIFPLSDYFSLG